MENKRAFTLIEILVVVAITTLIVIGIIVMLNPWEQLAKAYDTKRKTDLTGLSKANEDWYNDNGCYPKPNQICYPSTQSGYNPNSNTKCYFCGSNSQSPSFSPYLSKLPCDPRSPTKNYLYEVDNINCPKWFRIYAVSSAKNDPDSLSMGCPANGCGPLPIYGYGFGITSPNIGVQKTPHYWCFTRPSDGNFCRNCDTPTNCSLPPCTEIYASSVACCARSPKPSGCL